MVEKLHLKRNSLSDEIIRVIQSQILEEKLKPGERLPSEKEMCDLFSVGRSTLREAIKALIIAGLLEKKKDGTYVKSNFDFIFKSPFDSKLALKHTNQKDLLEARKILEVQIVGLSAERATEEDLVQMGIILESMEEKIKNQDNLGFIQDDVDLHLTIAECSYNTVLINQIKTIKNLLINLQSDLLKLPIIPQCHKYHSLIFDAICKRDVKNAQNLMAEHINDVERALVKELSVDSNN